MPFEIESETFFFFLRNEIGHTTMLLCGSGWGRVMDTSFQALEKMFVSHWNRSIEKYIKSPYCCIPISVSDICLVFSLIICVCLGKTVTTRNRLANGTHICLIFVTKCYSTEKEVKIACDQLDRLDCKRAGQYKKDWKEEETFFDSLFGNRHSKNRKGQVKEWFPLTKK